VQDERLVWTLPASSRYATQNSGSVLQPRFQIHAAPASRKGSSSSSSSTLVARSSPCQRQQGDPPPMTLCSADVVPAKALIQRALSPALIKTWQSALSLQQTRFHCEVSMWHVAKATIFSMTTDPGTRVRKVPLVIFTNKALLWMCLRVPQRATAEPGGPSTRPVANRPRHTHIILKRPRLVAKLAHQRCIDPDTWHQIFVTSLRTFADNAHAGRECTCSSPRVVPSGQRPC